MSKKPVNNALSNYDNGVEEKAKGEGGFASGLLSGGGLSLGNIQGMISGLSGSVGSFMSEGITKLNSLGAGMMSGLMGIMPDWLQTAVNSVSGFMNTYLSSVTNMVKSMAGDALRQLQNAAVNYVQNIAEDFLNNLAASLYIPDIVFCETIKGLYYGAGADLAYNKHYLRKACLKRDWHYTLEFVDSCYGIDYNPEYKHLDSDLSVCSSNSCQGNLHYIFGMLAKIIDDAQHNKRISKINIDTISANDPENYKNDKNYDKYNEIYAEFNGLEDRYCRLMIRHAKALIVNSVTYVTPSHIRKIFDDYSRYIKPSYLGTTDPKYGGAYTIGESECVAMMPDWSGKHEVSKADQDYLSNVNNDIAQLQKESQEAASESQRLYAQYEESAVRDGNAGRSRTYIGTLEHTGSKIEQLRSNITKKHASRQGGLATTAVTRGHNGVYTQSKARYPKQNDLKDSVKYRKDITGALGSTVENLFYDDTKYTVLKNKNIKAIYILLSSREIYGNDRMVNEAFYWRCKIPTMTTLEAAADKAKGILGTSMIVQTALDLQNAIDSSAYAYTKKVEDWLLDPLKNISDPLTAAKVTFQIDPDSGELIFEEDTSGTSGGTSGSNGHTGSNTTGKGGFNPDAVTEADASPASRDINDSVKYHDSIPMMTTRSLLSKWLTYFYDLMTKKSIEVALKETSFANLCKYIFGVSDVTHPNKLEKVFDSSTKESLSNNSKVYISIGKNKTAHKVMKLEGNPQKTVICNLFYISSNLYNQNIRSVGFAKTLYLYDRDYLASYLKALFLDELDYLKSIADKNKKEFKLLYPSVDHLADEFEGFHKFGILGYHERYKRVQYTNVVVGDWSSSLRVEGVGLFFAGNETTKNNGIRRINSDENEIIKTNITDGDWKQIHGFFDQYVFFENYDGTLYYWDGKKVVYCNIDNMDEYQFLAIEDTEDVFIVSTADGGIKHWKDNRWDTLSSRGSGWKVQKFKYGIAIYPTITEGTPVLLGLNGDPRSAQTSVLCNHMAYFVKHVDNTVGTDVYVLFLYFGTPSSGIVSFSVQSKSKTTFDFKNITSTSTSSRGISVTNNLAVPINTGDYAITVLTPQSEITYNFKSKATVTTGANPSAYYAEIQSQNTVAQYNSVTECYPFKDFYIFVDDRTSRKEGIINYKRTYSSNNREVFDSRDISEGEFFVYHPDDTVYWRQSNGKGLSKVSGTKIVELFEGADTGYDGWELTYVDDRTLFAVNNKHSVGPRVYNGSKFVGTGLTSGYWYIGGTPNNYFALSRNNTNRGVKYSPVNRSGSVNFVDIPTINITYSDFNAFSYDKLKERVYFGIDRRDLIFDPSNINFDIDEYIYPLTEYEIQQHIISLDGKKLDAISATIEAMLENGEDVFIMSDVLNEQLNNITVDGKSLEAALAEINDPTFMSQLAQLTNPLDRARFLLQAAKSGKYPSLTPFISALEQFLEENKGFLSLESILDRMEKFSKKMEQGSGLYTNILTAANAALEFDVDNPSPVIASFLQNYDYGGDFENRYAIIARHKAEQAKTIILSDYTKDGKQIKEDRNSKEYKAKYLYTSSEFMNSDAEGNTY